MIRIAVFSVLALALAGSALAQRVEVIDGIAAIVNNDVVTISQVRELVGARERSLREIYSGTELENKLKEMRLSAIKDLIDRQLILQEFKKLQEKGASIPEYVVDDRVQAIIRQEFGGDRAAFRPHLAGTGLYADAVQGNRERKDRHSGDAPVRRSTAISSFRPRRSRPTTTRTSRLMRRPSR